MNSPVFYALFSRDKDVRCYHCRVSGVPRVEGPDNEEANLEMSNHRKPVRRWPAGAKATLAIVLGLTILGCTTVDPSKDNIRRNFSPRWTTNEIPFEDAEPREQVGRNIRDGIVGFFDSFFQGAFTLVLVASPTGTIGQKLGTILGDVVGLIDDNEYTEHVFAGILSRQLLRFGTSARNMAGSLAMLHGVTFDIWEEGEEPTILDYTNNNMFHTKVYGKPSVLAVIGATVVSDFMIRPAGFFITIFGQRESGQDLDEMGLNLLESAAKVNFY